VEEDGIAALHWNPDAFSVDIGDQNGVFCYEVLSFFKLL
jgi:hypothetical protein